MDIDDENLPVGLALIQQSHDTENLDLLDLTHISNLLANLAHIERVIVTAGLGFWVYLLWILPGLSNCI